MAREISFISSQIRLQYAMSVHWSILGSSKRRTIAAHEISSVKYYGRLETRHVNGFGKTGFYRPTDLLVKPYTNLAVTVPNHPFFIKTGIFKYFKAFFLSVFCDIKALCGILRPRLRHI
jgi:hypothetical protein